MSTLYVLDQGAQLHKESRRLTVRKDGEEMTSIPLFKVDQVMLFGNIGITTPALRALLADNIDVIFLTQDGQYRGRLVGAASPQVALRMAQYRAADDLQRTLGLARTIVGGKIKNLRFTLQRSARHLPAADAEVEDILGRLKGWEDDLLAAAQMSTVLGIEGRASRYYIHAFGRLITNPEFPFHTRTRRPPADPVNALLSFGYVVLTRRMESAVQGVGLDPYLGFLHGVAYNRPSLALDLVEEFRSVIVDSVVLRCVNNRLLEPRHFERRPAEGGKGKADAVWLMDEGKAIYLRELERRFNEEVTHPLTGERVTYVRCMELQAREMARALREEDIYRPFVRR